MSDPRWPEDGRYDLSAATRLGDPVTEPVATSTPAVAKTPEPLISAEAIRGIVVLVVGAVWATPLPDPILDIVVDGAAGLVGIGVSVALTMIARGKVWAIRRGVDVDHYLDEVQSRTNPPAGM